MVEKEHCPSNCSDAQMGKEAGKETTLRRKIQGKEYEERRQGDKGNKQIMLLFISERSSTVAAAVEDINNNGNSKRYRGLGFAQACAKYCTAATGVCWRHLTDHRFNKVLKPIYELR
jgi:hypothetical protein